MVFLSNLDVCDCLYVSFRKVYPQCNTVVYVKRSVCDCGHAFVSKESTAVREAENALKHRKALLWSEEELLVRKETQFIK